MVAEDAGNAVADMWQTNSAAEMMMGYGDATNAYRAIASQISRTVSFVVSVRPW